MRNLLLLILLLININNLQGQSFSKEEFLNPPVSHWPRPLWFWNNTTVTSEEIVKQMKAFHDSCGYGGFGILPFGKRFKPEYLSEEYFKIYRKALETAKETGLKMCLYDEFGFPSGGAGAVNGDDKPRFALKYPDQTIKRLDKFEKEVKGPAQISEKIPAGTLMGIVGMESQTLQRVDLSGHISNREFKWDVPQGNWKVMIFICVKDGDPIVDYLNPKAVRNFIKMTHEAYYENFRDYFGNVISGTFFDEPTMYRANGRMWTESFNKEFEKKYHFNPIRFYPALWYDIGPETQSARNFLFGFRTELYARGFTKEVNDWSEKHGITATGHQDQEEIQNPVSVSGDLMKCFKYLQIPGVDKIGGNRPAEKFYKIISSAAYNWDRSLVMSETYGAMGNLSWNEMYAVAMDQYSKGINMLIPHAVWYDDKNVTFKPELSQRNPLYKDSLKSFNLFLSRLNTILQQKGRHIADIAVLYPIYTLQGEHHLDGSLGYYQGGVEIPQTDYINISEWLTNYAGKDFTFLHPEVLDEKCIINKSTLLLRNKNNWENYKLLIVPSCKTISLSNLRKIHSFYEQGGKVIFTTQLPFKSSDLNKDAEVNRIISSIFPNAISHSDLISSNKNGGKAFFISNPDELTFSRILQQTGINFDITYSTNENLRYLHKRTSDADVVYISNIGSSAVNTLVGINNVAEPEIWDPHTGKITKPDYQQQGKQIQIKLYLPARHSCFVICKQRKFQTN